MTETMTRATFSATKARRQPAAAHPDLERCACGGSDGPVRAEQTRSGAGSGAQRGVTVVREVGGVVRPHDLDQLKQPCGCVHPQPDGQPGEVPPRLCCLEGRLKLCVGEGCPAPVQPPPRVGEPRGALLAQILQGQQRSAAAKLPAAAAAALSSCRGRRCGPGPPPQEGTRVPPGGSSGGGDEVQI